MSDPDLIMDVFLHPGDLYFGDADTRLRTILGSCVTITMWHPKRRIGGMSHCLLPGTGRQVTADQLDGKYVDEALTWLMLEAVRNGTRPRDYQFKLFGGSDMFEKAAAGTAPTIGRQNVAQAVAVLAGLGLSILTHDIGGHCSRSLIFEIATGDAWIRHGIRTQTPTQNLEFQP